MGPGLALIGRLRRAGSCKSQGRAAGTANPVATVFINPRREPLVHCNRINLCNFGATALYDHAAGRILIVV
jgi:hypothetical protein